MITETLQQTLQNVVHNFNTGKIINFKQPIKLFYTKNECYKITSITTIKITNTTITIDCVCCGFKNKEYTKSIKLDIRVFVDCIIKRYNTDLIYV